MKRLVMVDRWTFDTARKLAQEMPTKMRSGDVLGGALSITVQMMAAIQRSGLGDRAVDASSIPDMYIRAVERLTDRAVDA